MYIIFIHICIQCKEKHLVNQFDIRVISIDKFDAFEVLLLPDTDLA